MSTQRYQLKNDATAENAFWIVAGSLAMLLCLCKGIWQHGRSLRCTATKKRPDEAVVDVNDARHRRKRAAVKTAGGRDDLDGHSIHTC